MIEGWGVAKSLSELRIGCGWPERLVLGQGLRNDLFGMYDRIRYLMLHFRIFNGVGEGTSGPIYGTTFNEV